MAVMSLLQRVSSLGKIPFRKGLLASEKSFLSLKSTSNAALITRFMSGGHHRTMPITPSIFMKKKFYDAFHFYLALGVIPLSLMTLLVNIYVGPAELTETPEGYEPKHWEYFEHPVSRFIARYIIPSPQQDYEKNLHMMGYEHTKATWRLNETKVHNLMRERGDYKAWYYRPVTGKYDRALTVDADDEGDSISGSSEPMFNH